MWEVFWKTVPDWWTLKVRSSLWYCQKDYVDKIITKQHLKVIKKELHKLPRDQMHRIFFIVNGKWIRNKFDKDSFRLKNKVDYESEVIHFLQT